MLFTLRTMTAVIGLLAAAGCAEVDKEDLPDTTKHSNVATTEPSPGVIVGQFKKDGGQTQTLVASGQSEIRDFAIDLPPGALTVDTAITMQQGNNLSGKALAELGVTAGVVSGANPVSVSAEPAIDLSRAMTLSIPLPLTNDESKLSLVDEPGRLGVLYVKTLGGNSKVGIQMIGPESLKGAIIQLASPSFGWYRLVYFAETVDPIEKDTQLSPQGN